MSQPLVSRRARNIGATLLLGSLAALIFIATVAARNKTHKPSAPPVSATGASVILPGAPQGQRKLALLVGVSNYPGYTKGKRDVPAGKGWLKLNTKNDLEGLAAVLLDKFGFQPADIKIVSDETVTVAGKRILPVTPTHEAIIAAFKTHLIEQTKPGDIVYFHFSGHGIKVPDDDKHGPNPQVGDELDGMDETLVPIDGISTADGSKNIRDDELSDLLGKLSEKQPSNVVVSLDSCYSGTATRGSISVVRGATWSGTPVAANKARGEDEDAADFVTQGRTRGDGGANAQSYIFLAAASAKEKANEITEKGLDYGAFTLALVRAMEHANERTTYRDLFDTVSDVISRAPTFKQTPQIEGTQRDNLVFANGAAPPRAFVSVKLNDAGKPQLAAGHLQGMTVGSKFNLCPPAAKECPDAERIAEASITAVAPTSAELELTGKVVPARLKTVARAFETAHNYDAILRVAIKDAPATRGGNAIGGVFERLGLIGEVSAAGKDWNIMLRAAGSDDVKDGLVAADFRGWILQRPDGSIIKSVADDDTALREIESALTGEARWLTIKSLDDTADPALADAIEIKMIPVDGRSIPGSTGKYQCLTDKPIDSLRRRGGTIELRENEFVRLEIANRSAKDLYVTLLDLTPEGKISAVFPDAEHPENTIPAGKLDYRVPPGRNSCFRITKPTGRESFRAIVTEEPTDFSPLLNVSQFETRQRGRQLDSRAQNAANTPLGKILLSAQGSRTAGKQRGIEIATAPPSWATKSIQFLVVPANDD